MPQPHRRPARAWLVVGVLLLAASWWAARDTSAVSSWEGTLTVSVNQWPAWIAWLMWPVMLAGDARMVLILPAVVYAWQRRGRAAAAAALAPLMALSTARIIKEVAARGRPADYLEGIDVRDPVSGFGFASGHAAVAFACAVVVAAYLPPRWRLLPLGLALATGFSRIYFGAHLPLDVVGGAGLGLVCGGVGLALMREPPEPLRTGTSPSDAHVEG